MSPELSALYRLFLRAVSASVLHHQTATRNLRKLWRPSFVEMAKLDAEKKNTQLPEDLRVLEAKMHRYNEIFDNTLRMLYSSATSRGLSHRVTRNLGFLTDAHIKSGRPRSIRAWNPSLPADSSVYKAPLQSTKEQEKMLQRKIIDESVSHSLDEIVQLAEGRSGITLGKFPPDPKTSRGEDEASRYTFKKEKYNRTG